MEPINTRNKTPLPCIHEIVAAGKGKVKPQPKYQSSRPDAVIDADIAELDDLIDSL